MAHWSYLRSCRSQQEAVADFVPDDSAGAVELGSRYSIPLFWLAAFDSKNILRAHSADALAVGANAEDGFLVLCASGAEAVNRLRTRAACIIKLLPPVYAPFFEEWIRFVKASFPHYLVLRAEDVFSMGDQRDAELRVTAALRSLSRADEGKPIKELDALDYCGGFRGLFGTRPANEQPPDTAMRIRTQLAGYNSFEPTALNGWPRSATAAELTFIGGIEVPADPPLSSEQARVAKAIREGLAADTLRKRIAVAAGKLRGRIPLGADAPTKGLRKAIGGGGELLKLLRSGFLAILGLLFGSLFLWAGLSGVIQWSLIGLGLGCLLVAVFLLLSAARALRNLRAITRA